MTWNDTRSMTCSLLPAMTVWQRCDEYALMRHSLPIRIGIDASIPISRRQMH